MKIRLPELVILSAFGLVGWINYWLANLVPTGWIAVAVGIGLFLVISSIWFHDLVWDPGSYFDDDENLVGILVLVSSVPIWLIAITVYGFFVWLYPATWLLTLLAGLMWFAFWMVAGPLLISYYFVIRCRSEQLGA